MLDAYVGVAHRILEMTDAASDAELEAPVPATPGWAGRDVVAHLAGLCQDWVTGNLDGYASESWTAAQVTRFEGQPASSIAEAWRRALDDFVRLDESPIGQTPAQWAFGDALTHEADLRPVLAPGTRPTDDAVAIGTKTAVSRWRAQLAEIDAPPLRILEPNRDWLVGARAPEGAETATVAVDRHELFRALFGRRSLAQVQAWDWSEAPEPWLVAGLPYPFAWADDELVD